MGRRSKRSHELLLKNGRGSWRLEEIRRVFNIPSHGHISIKRMRLGVKALEQGYRQLSRPIDEPPLRVYKDGWPDRPPPERPKRGRGSEAPRKKVERRMFNVGDLLVIPEQGVDIVELDGKMCVLQVRYRHGPGWLKYNGFSETYMYLGPDDNAVSSQWYGTPLSPSEKIFGGGQALFCATDTLALFKRVKRIDKALG
jgi:hypothetical protein